MLDSVTKESYFIRDIVNLLFQAALEESDDSDDEDL